MDMAARMTLCNMAIEAGGTSGICCPDMHTVDYLWPHIQTEYSSREAALEAFKPLVSDPDADYDAVMTIDISELTPMVTHGFRPDNVKPVQDMLGTVVDQVYIGSCTNGRIEDLQAAAQALGGNKISERVRAILSPATPEVYQKALDQGLIKIFMEAGFCVTNPTCGACLGMSNGVLAEGEVCASTTNRNFNGRMGKGGRIHLMSPATAAATAIAGHITNSKLFEA